MAPSTSKKKPGPAPALTDAAKPVKKPAAAKSAGAKTSPARPATTKAVDKPADRSANAKSPARTAAGSPNPKTRSTRRSTAATSVAMSDRPISRALMAFDDDDVLPSGGSGGGVGYGRCGGRMLSSKVERLLCDLLSRDGVAHSHSPRHFEIQLDDQQMAAYAPMIVVRGRGREGKTIVIEALDEIEPSLLEKVRAFRKLYGLEFYVSFVGSEELLDEVPIDAYDESTVVQNVSALVSRLAE